MWFSHGEVYSMQFYMRKFSPDTPVSSTNKTDRYDIAEILLKVKHHKPTNQPTNYWKESENSSWERSLYLFN